MRKALVNPGYSVNWTEAESGELRQATHLTRKGAFALGTDLRANPEVDDVWITVPDGKEIKL